MAFDYHPILKKSIYSLVSAFSVDGISDANKRLSRFTSVGATYDKGDARTLSFEDSGYIYSTLLHLGILGIGFHPDFAHTNQNIAHDPREDFLDNPPLTDVLMVCHIPFHVAGISVDGKAGLKISSKHFLKDSWQKAAEQSGTKVISIFGRGREVCGRHFVQDRSSPFLEIPDHVLRASHLAKQPNGHYHSPAEILIDKNYAASLIGKPDIPEPFSEYLSIYLR